MNPAKEPEPTTLGDVLYAVESKPLVSEKSWVKLIEAIGRGDQLALQALYERSHRVVFTLIMRVTGNREIAEELTLEVFYGVWRRAYDYDAEYGTVLGWIMNQTRARAVDWLRLERREKQMNPHASAVLPAGEKGNFPAMKQQIGVMQRAMMFLTADERQVIEAAFISGLTYAEMAVRLNQPLRTVKTRIRSGLHKLRQALTAEASAR